MKALKRTAERRMDFSRAVVAEFVSDQCAPRAAGLAFASLVASVVLVSVESRKPRLLNSGDSGSDARILPTGRVAFSPNGESVAFETVTETESRGIIYLQNSTEVRALADGREPSWAPFGVDVVYLSPSRDEIRLINTEGGLYRRLIRLDGAEFRSPLWAPDGSRLVVEVAPTGTFDAAEPVTGVIDIAVVQRGGEYVIIGDPVFADINASWSPQGSRIAFQSNRDGNWEIYSASADGSKITRITEDPGQDVHPAW